MAQTVGKVIAKSRGLRYDPYNAYDICVGCGKERQYHSTQGDKIRCYIPALARWSYSKVFRTTTEEQDIFNSIESLLLERFEVIGKLPQLK